LTTSSRRTKSARGAPAAEEVLVAAEPKVPVVALEAVAIAESLVVAVELPIVVEAVVEHVAVVSPGPATPEAMLRVHGATICTMDLVGEAWLPLQARSNWSSLTWTLVCPTTTFKSSFRNLAGSKLPLFITTNLVVVSALPMFCSIVKLMLLKP
jgi:hypothetical protein